MLQHVYFLYIVEPFFNEETQKYTLMHKLHFKTHHLILGFNLFLMFFLLFEILYPSENRVEEQLSTFYSQTKIFILREVQTRKLNFT